MGTNYYLIDSDDWLDGHIGKRSSLGKDGSSFSWARGYDIIDPLPPRKKAIRDDKGNKFTKKQFMDIVNNCSQQLTHMMGKTFR